MIYTNTDTINAKRDLSEVIDLLDPFETPMLDMVGRDSLSVPCTQTKHEWMTDRLNPQAGTLASAYVAGSSAMTLTSSEGKFLYTDDLILLGNMVFRVESGPPDADVLVVTLLAGTDAAVAAGQPWRKIIHAAPEGAPARVEQKKTTPEIPYNYTHIVKDWAIVTGTMEHIARYGYVSERAYQEEKILKNLAMNLENVLIYGVRSWVDGPPRKSTMGGLFDFVFLTGLAASTPWETVKNLAGEDFTEKEANNMMQVMWGMGGKPDFWMVNGTNKRRISDWGKPSIRTERTETTAGASIGTYESDFGTVDIILNRNLRASDIIFGTKGSLGIGPLQGRQFSSKLLPVAGDYTQWEILGEYTMEVSRPSQDFAWFYNTSTVY